MGEWELKPGKLKSYPHFDAPASLAEANSLPRDPDRVKSHCFYPFLLFREEWWPFGRKSEETPEKKSRKIRYAARRDAYIYSYYRHLLSERYEVRLRELGISDSVIAYRKMPIDNDGRGGKCNIHFARDAYETVSRLGNCCAVALDISKFFESIDHLKLKGIWCDLLDVSLLPEDHWAVFKSITRYSEVDRDLAYEKLGFARRRLNGGWEYTAPKHRMPIQLCLPSVFRRAIAGDKRLIRTNPNHYGIPQGAPLSDLLANAYLLEFDVKMAKYAQSRGGLYWRYSDDILIVIPGDGRAGHGARKHATRLIKEAGEKLAIKSEKASTVVFRVSGARQVYRCIGGRRRNGLEYLGFRFDGQNIFLRDSTISNLNRKIARAVRAEAIALVRRFRGKDLDFLVSQFRVDEFMQKFGRVEDFDPVDGPEGWTFWTYARRAASVLGPQGLCIFNQLKKLRQKIERFARQAIQETLASGVPTKSTANTKARRLETVVAVSQ